MFLSKKKRNKTSDKCKESSYKLFGNTETVQPYVIVNELNLLIQGDMCLKNLLKIRSCLLSILKN